MKKNLKGFSLVEMLVAVAIFSVLGVVMAQTILLSVRTAKRSENTTLVRAEVDQVVNLLENQLRNADEIVSCNSTNISYTDSSGVSGRSFTITTDEINWNTRRINSTNVSFASSSFACSGRNPDTITVTINAQSSGAGTAEASSIQVRTEIKPRYYVD